MLSYEREVGGVNRLLTLESIQVTITRRLLTMSSTRLYRLSGISLLIGCVLIVLVTIPGVFINSDPASAYSVYSSLGRVIGGILLLLGLPGVYVRQSQRAGVLGLV